MQGNVLYPYSNLCFHVLSNNNELFSTCIDKGVSILKWNTSTWEKISSNLIARDPISAFNVSADGKHFAV